MARSEGAGAALATHASRHHGSPLDPPQQGDEGCLPLVSVATSQGRGPTGDDGPYMRPILNGWEASQQRWLEEYRSAEPGDSNGRRSTGA
jgi:hypothetical protein